MVLKKCFEFLIHYFVLQDNHAIQGFNQAAPMCSIDKHLKKYYINPISYKPKYYISP